MGLVTVSGADGDKWQLDAADVLVSARSAAVEKLNEKDLRAGEKSCLNWSYPADILTHILRAKVQVTDTPRRLCQCGQVRMLFNAAVRN